MAGFEDWFDQTANEMGLTVGSSSGKPMAHSQGEDGDDDRGQRLIGYDAPETYKPSSTGHSKIDTANPNAYLAIEAKEQIAKTGGRVIDTKEDDYYGRDLMEGVTGKNTRLANEMTAAGLALPMDDDAYSAWAAAQTARAMGIQGSNYSELEELGQVAMNTPVELGAVRPWYEGHDFGTQGKGFGDAVGRGIDQMQGDIGGLLQWFGRSTGAKNIEEYGRKQALHNDFQLQNNAPEIARFDDIESISDVLTYAVETAGSLAPQLITDLAIGAVTGGAGLAAAAARTTLTRVAAGQALKRGAMVGAAGSSIGQGIGGMENTLQEAGVESTFAPLIAGTAMGALDILPVFDAIEKLASTAGIGDQAKRTVLERVGNTLLATTGTGLKEGATSVAQGIIEQATLATQDPNYEWSQDKFFDIVDQGIRGVIGGGMAMGASTGGIEMYHHAADTMKAYDERRAAEIDAALESGTMPEPELAASALDLANDAVAKSEISTIADKVAGEPAKKGLVIEDDRISLEQRQAEEKKTNEVQTNASIAVTGDTQDKTKAILEAQKAEGIQTEGSGIVGVTIDEYGKDITTDNAPLRPVSTPTPQQVTSVAEKTGAPIVQPPLEPRPFEEAALPQQQNQTQVAHDALAAEIEASKKVSLDKVSEIEKQIVDADEELAAAEREFESKQKGSHKKLVKERATRKVEQAREKHKSTVDGLNKVIEQESQKMLDFNSQRQELTEQSTEGVNWDDKTAKSAAATNLEVAQQYNNKIENAKQSPDVTVTQGITPKGKKSAVTVSNAVPIKEHAANARQQRTEFVGPQNQSQVDQLRTQAYEAGKAAMQLTEEEAQQFKEKVIAFGIQQNPSAYAGFELNADTQERLNKRKQAKKNEPEQETPALKKGDKVDVHDQGERVGLGTGENRAPKVGIIRERKIRNIMVTKDSNGKYKLRPLSEAISLAKQRGYNPKDMAGFLTSSLNPNGAAPLRVRKDERQDVGIAIMGAIEYNEKRSGVTKNEKTKKDNELRQLLTDFDNGVEMTVESIKSQILMKGYKYGKAIAEARDYDWQRMYLESGGAEKPSAQTQARRDKKKKEDTDSGVAKGHESKQKEKENQRDIETVKQVFISMLEGAIATADKVKQSFATHTRSHEYSHDSDYFKKTFGTKVATALEMHYGSKGKGGHVVAMLASAIDWLNTGSKESSIELRRLADIVQRDFKIKTTKKENSARIFEILDAALKELPTTGTDAKSRGGSLKYSAFDAYKKANSLNSVERKKQKAYLDLYEKVSRSLDPKYKGTIDLDKGISDETKLDLMVLRLGADFLGQNKDFIEAAYADIEAENFRNMEQSEQAEITVYLDDSEGGKIDNALEVTDAENQPLVPWIAAFAKKFFDKDTESDPDDVFTQPTTKADLIADGWLTQEEADAAGVPDSFVDILDIDTLKKDREIRGQQVFDLMRQLGSLMRGEKKPAFTKLLVDVAAKISGRVDGKDGLHLYPARISVRFGDETVKYSDSLTEDGDNTKRPMNRNLRSTVLAKIQDILRDKDASIEEKAAGVETILRQNHLLDDNAQSYVHEAKGTNDVGTIGDATLSRIKYKSRKKGITGTKGGETYSFKPHELTKLGMARTVVDETSSEDDSKGASVKRSLRIRIYEGFLAGISAIAGEGYDIDPSNISRDTVIYYALNDKERPVTWGEIRDYAKDYIPNKHFKQDEAYYESQKSWFENNADELEKLGVDVTEWESLLGTAELEVIKAEMQARSQTMEGNEGSEEYNSLAETHDNQAAEIAENTDLRKNDSTIAFNTGLENDAATRKAVSDASKNAAKQAQEAMERGVDVDKLPKGRSAQLERSAKNGMRISKARPILTAWVRGTRTRLSRLQYKIAEAVDRVVIDSDARFNAFRSQLDEAMGDDLNAGLEDYNTGRDTDAARRFSEVMEQVFSYAELANPDFTKPDVIAQLKRDALLADRSTFITILKEAGIKDAKGMYDELIKSDGFLDTGVIPQVSGISRKMQELAPAYEALKNAGYIDDDAGLLLTSFLHGITQRTEWAKEFGRTVDGKFDINYGYETNTRILQPSDIIKVHELVNGALGNLGRNNYPSWLRKTNTALLTLQTATVLWLAGVASIPELGSVFVANKGNLKQFHRDIAAVGRAHSFDRAQSREIAEAFGLVSRSITEHTLTQLVANGEITGNKVARGVSNFVFKWSGQNLITDMSRISGTVMGRDYLARNAKAALKGDTLAKERLYELGVTEQQIASYLLKEGANNGQPIRLDYTRDANGKASVDGDVEAYHMALARFVEGSTAVPNRMDVPLLMNDPRYVLLTSLKKFFYGYWNTVHKGIVRDVKQRKGVDKITPPIIAVAAILPLAFCAEWLREEIKYPSILGKERQQRLTITDWIQKIISASGGLGPAQAVASALTASEFSGNFLTALMGPTVNLGLDMVNGDLAKNPARLVPIVGQQPQLRAGFNKTAKEIIHE